MLQLLLSFLGGPVVNGLLAAYRARIAQLNSQDEMALTLLQKEIDAEIAARAEASKVLLAEQGHWYTAMIRPLFAIPFIIFEFKVIVLDKALHLGSTDALDANFWSVFQVVVGAYFGATAIERVSRIFKR
jgi:hypothetical protein